LNYARVCKALYKLALVFSDYKKILKLPRQFIINVLNSVKSMDFKIFVEERISERNARIIMEKQNFIEILPELKNAFMSSSYISRKYLMEN